MVPMQATILVNVLKRYMFRTFTNRWTPRYMRCSTGYNETIHEFSKQSDRFLIVTIDYIYIYSKQQVKTCLRGCQHIEQVFETYSNMEILI
jgi:hypothetical protein